MTSTVKATGNENVQDKNSKMNQERSFLSKMFEEALHGHGSALKALVLNYALEHKISCFEVLSQFKDGNKRNALHFACQGSATPTSDGNGEEDILRILLSPQSGWLSQSNIESLLRLKDKEGLTCCMIAAQHPDRALGYKRVHILIDVGGNKLALARSKSGATPLHYAAGVGACRKTILLLYNAGKVALQTCSKQGGTPLHWVAGTSPKKEKEDDFAETLNAIIVDCQVDINAPNEQGIPPLILAAAANNDKHASILVGKGADVTKILPGNVTVFHMAADLNLIFTLAALLNLDQTRVDITKYIQMKNDQGETPLDLAATEGHTGCVMLLLPENENSEEHASQYIQLKQKSVKSQNNSSSSAKPETTETDTTTQSSKTNEMDTEAKTIVHQIQKNSNACTNEQKNEAAQHKIKGNQYFSNHEYIEAINEYTSAIDLNESDATYYSNRSACYHHLKQYEKAILDAHIAKHLRPEWSKPYFRMAVSQLAMQLFEDAACSAWEGLQLDQTNHELKKLLQTCVKKGKENHKESLTNNENGRTTNDARKGR